MANILSQSKDRQEIKKYARKATIVHILLFPFLLWYAGMTGLVADSPSLPQSIAIAVVCIHLFIPLSVPLTLYFIWTRYLRGNYRSCYRCCFITRDVFFVTQLLTGVLLIIF